MRLGDWLPALAALVARMQGPSRFAGAMGYVGPMMISFQMLGAPAAAYVYDQTARHDLALYGFLAAFVLSLPLHSRL